MVLPHRKHRGHATLEWCAFLQTSRSCGFLREAKGHSLQTEHRNFSNVKKIFKNPILTFYSEHLTNIHIKYYLFPRC